MSHLASLLSALAGVQKGGQMKPLRSSVGLALGPGVYAIAGASSLKEYLVLAANAGIVEGGGTDGYAWVKLHPDVPDGRRRI
jgi:hypothetical protein